MESDSTLSTLALFVSLICFTVIAVAEAGIRAVRREEVLRLVSESAPGSATLDRLYGLPMGPAGALRLTKAAAFSGVLVSAVAIVIVGVGVRWLPIGVASLAAAVLLAVLHGVAPWLASRRATSVALRAAPLARGLAWLLNPILALESAIGGSSRAISEQEISAEVILPLNPDLQPLDEHEVRMIRGVVRLDKTVAREIMVPRVDMVTAEITAPLAELAGHMVRGGHSRIPVYSGEVDHIDGIAYARDVLDKMLGDQGATTSVESVIRPALFIPESKTLEELLDEFQERQVHMAIVVDEYGGVSGLVTIEDLLEEIVGEIRDEFDAGESEIEQSGDDEFLIDARLSLEQLNQLLSVSVEGDGFDTLGGFVYHRLGKIPSSGDTVEYDGLKIEVISTIGRRLKRLKVTRSTRDPSDP